MKIQTVINQEKAKIIYCHLKQTKTSILFSLARRIKSKVTDETKLKTRMDELRRALLKQSIQKP